MASPLLARFTDEPILISRSAQNSLASYLEQASAFSSRISMAEQAGDRPMMADDFWPQPNDWRAQFRPYNVKDGILTIPVIGVLLSGFPWQVGSWATGYPYIAKAVERGMADSAVTGIVFNINSPGGEVSGNFDLVDKLFAMRGQKPMVAVANEHAYSAAYSLASAADKIIVARTGGVGSIGVVTSHVDYSGALEQDGVKVTFIYFGDHKVDGNPYEPLPEDVKARIQARVDELGEIFVATVARNRGIEAQAVRDTQALTFTASQSLSNGLADEIGTLDDAMAAFAANLSSNRRRSAMAGQAEEKAVDQAAVDQARADGFAAGKAEGMTAGATAERARISAIVSSDAGKARPTLALKMATGEKFAALDADTVVEMLNDMPEEKASAENKTGKNFTAAMNESQNADVGVPGDGDSANNLSRAERALARNRGPRKAS